MQIVISNASSTKPYSKISNLSFYPSADIMSSLVPINEFYADIHTTDTIDLDSIAILYDDNHNMWARYWICAAEKMGSNITRINAQSALLFLDRITLPAIMYNNEPLANVIDTIFAGVSTLHGLAYTVDASFASATVSGFCPEQSARDRLQWVCFVIGGHVETAYNSNVEILPVDDTTTLIPLNRIKWKPTVAYNDVVTQITVKAYSYRVASPGVTDTWVTDGTNYYIEEEQEFTLVNPDVPLTASDNIVSVDGITIINSNNANSILLRLAQYYFQKIEVTATVVNRPGEEPVKPGHKYTVFTDSDTAVTGYAFDAIIDFRRASQSTVTIRQLAEIATANLTIYGVYDNITRAIHSGVYPVGYQYQIENLHVDVLIGLYRYVLYPENEYATGTIVSGTNEDYETYYLALLFTSRTVNIYNVDDVDEAEGVITIE